MSSRILIHQDESLRWTFDEADDSYEDVAEAIHAAIVFCRDQNRPLQLVTDFPYWLKQKAKRLGINLNARPAKHPGTPWTKSKSQVKPVWPLKPNDSV